MIQLALFPRPVEPENVEADVRADPFSDHVGLSLSRLPAAPVGDLAYERFGLGPIRDVPREVAARLRECNRWGG